MSFLQYQNFSVLNQTAMLLSEFYKDFSEVHLGWNGFRNSKKPLDCLFNTGYKCNWLPEATDYPLVRRSEAVCLRSFDDMLLLVICFSAQVHHPPFLIYDLLETQIL